MGMTKRERPGFLRLVLCALGASVLLPAMHAEGQGEPAPFARYGDVLETIKKRGHKLRVLGYAPDRSPLVVIQAGGPKKPAIFISAGSHATEHAGVAAAVELIDRLPTQHQLFVLPCRDPIGMNGYRYALSLGLGEEPVVGSVAEAEALLRQKGEVLHDADGTLLAIIGDYGYANRSLAGRFKKGDKVLEALKGRRLFYPSRSTDIPGTGPLERAYTQVVTPEGEVLHLNRFHDTAWAPSEVRCARRLMAEIQPGLCFDLHEYGGDAFWFSARRQRSEEDERWELRMAGAAIKAVAASGAKLAPADYSPGLYFTRLERGAFWLDPQQRGEGLNLIDFAAARYGPGFTIETGMRQPFAHRVRLQMLTVQTAVKVFEERYRLPPKG